MNYIRTKDEIIKIEYEWEYASCGGITVYNENENLYIADDDIIKTADTVEELFDAFVSNNHIVPLKVIVEYGHHSNYENTYGAIWTDEGLIYKAKMKGVLSNGEIDWELL